MERFETALSHVLRHEGGFVDHPADPGGATNRGVTQGTYDAFRRDNSLEPQSVRLIEDAEVTDIYRSRYWQAVGADKLPPALAFVAFDSAVNHGVARTKAWLKGIRSWRDLILTRLQFYVGLSTFDTFGKGWTRRLAAVTAEAETLDEVTAPTSDRLLLLHAADGSELDRVPVPPGADVLLRVSPDGRRFWLRFDERTDK